MRLTACAAKALIAFAALATAIAVGPAPASGHAEGDSQTLSMETDGNTLTAMWTAPADDLLVLGALTGAIPEQREYVFELDEDGDHEQVGDSDAQLLADSPEVADYLAEHVTVRQNGNECPVEVDLSELAHHGAELTFECRDPVEAVQVEVTTLTDADPEYRTLVSAEDADEDHFLYTSAESVHEWHFDAGAGGPQAAVLLAAGAALLILIATAVVFAMRRLNTRALAR
ncbi:hypothetical protein [Glycomyces buryatensis]|uniref:Uncharacterized protein n=1 Tax=Glycomyces buryatensis TaxID=2570927 RepID=A0A4S8PPG1_9ACTN|nr:hypothetical protein [Glycomyces buryatensis]THV32903.1 hypothetical protein FAB82_26740 [Glycomyces buryatensis]